MNFRPSLYIDESTLVHALDARVKIVLLLAYSISIFLTGSWFGVGLFTAVALFSLALAKLPLGRILVLLLPVFVLASFAVFFNAVADPDGFQGLSVGFLVGLRMVDLCVMSFIVCFTTTSAQLMHAFGSLISPLRVFRFPLDDIAFALSLAIRFIPLVYDCFEGVRVAQLSRAAKFYRGALFDRVKAWGAVFVPLFVGLFRRADSVAVAMDARCFGASDAVCGFKRTPLCSVKLSFCDLAVLIGLLAVFIFAAVLV